MRRIDRRPLPQGRQIQPEAFTDTALGIFDLAVYQFGRNVDKTRRDVNQQRLEPPAVLQLILGLFAGERIGEYLREKLQPLHNSLRPISFLP